MQIRTRAHLSSQTLTRTRCSLTDRKSTHGLETHQPGWSQWRRSARHGWPVFGAPDRPPVDLLILFLSVGSTQCASDRGLPQAGCPRSLGPAGRCVTSFCSPHRAGLVQPKLREGQRDPRGNTVLKSSFILMTVQPRCFARRRPFPAPRSKLERMFSGGHLPLNGRFRPCRLSESLNGHSHLPDRKLSCYIEKRLDSKPRSAV